MNQSTFGTITRTSIRTNDNPFNSQTQIVVKLKHKAKLVRMGFFFHYV